MCHIGSVGHLPRLLIEPKMLTCFDVKYVKYNFQMWDIADCEVNMQI